jgi:hypothetical protein
VGRGSRVNRAEPSATRTNARRPKKGPARDRALALLLEGQTVPEVAAELRCGRVTVWSWTKDPSFSAELAARRSAARDLAELRIAEVAVEAIDTLRAVMAERCPPPHSRWRIAAAEAVLRLAWPARQGPAVAVAITPPGPSPRNPEREAIVAQILAHACPPRTIEAEPREIGPP